MSERSVSEVVADLLAIHPTATGREAAALLERLDADIQRLAEVIMHEVPGEPSQSEGAIDCAIRLLRLLAALIVRQPDAVEEVVGYLRSVKP